MAEIVYFDTSIFIEMSDPKSSFATQLDLLLEDLQDRKVRIYTSILTVQEMSVMMYRRGTVPKDRQRQIKQFARIYTVTKDIAVCAAKREAELKDLADDQEKRRNKKKPLTEQQKIDRACENRRRKWDCFHIATAQILECPTIYSTDPDLQKRPRQLNIKNLQIIPPPLSLRTIDKGSLIEYGKEQAASQQGLSGDDDEEDS